MLRPLSAALFFLALLLPPIGVIGEDWGAQTTPSESECRPYIEKALKELGPTDSQEEIEVLSAEEGQILSEWNEHISPEIARTEEVESETVTESLENPEVQQEVLLEPGSEESDAARTDSGLKTEEVSEDSAVVEEAPSSLANTEEDVQGEAETTTENVPVESAELTEDVENVSGTEQESEPATEGEPSISEISVEESLEIQEEPVIEGPLPPDAPVSGESEEIHVIPEESAESKEGESISSEDAEQTVSAASEESGEIKLEPEEEQTQNLVEESEVKPPDSEETVSTEAEGTTEPEVAVEAEIAAEPETVIEPEVAVESIPEEVQETVQSEADAVAENEEIKPTTVEESGEISASVEEEKPSEPVSEEQVSSETVTGGEELSTEEIQDSAPQTEVSVETSESLEVEPIASAAEEELEKVEPEPVQLDTEKVQAEEPSQVETATTEEIYSETVSETSIQEPDAGTVERTEEESIKDVVTDDSTAEKELSEEQVTEEKAPSEEVPFPEEDLTLTLEIPHKLRPREHISEILRLDKDTVEMELLLTKSIDVTLRELKRLYETAIKPLEILYKYRDLSNRHFGDPEIFSKPLILFMGPWSGGKSTIINYLLDNEFKMSALRTGAEPSPAYFNIVMWGENEEVLDGTQLAADWTFSGLQKFGQGLLDRLRGLKLNHPLLSKVNIVEIPGILEIRKQVERLFPFNDACQWFIDRADIIFLVYDPAKLDVGPESEAILDQLKGREYQTRIILNKADQVRPEELMRVQGTLIWNISPLMSSTEPPVMYSTSLWSIPYESGSPTRLLYAQEKAFLKDLRDAIDKRVENKIASARRFAVRVRNHAKMVDCYLTTYYNHKSFFGNRKKVSDDIIEHPQNYHIYEGLSTLTNISRYDLPDPEVYKDFFRLNPVYDFQQLSATCTYFRGCPINRLDVAIAYELPELVGKYKKSAEEVLQSVKKNEKS